MTEPDDRLNPRLHHLWLRLAGWAGDEVTSAARRWLAEGRLSEAALAAARVVHTGQAPIRPEDADLLVRLLPDVPETAGLAGVAVPAGPAMPAPPFDFAPVLPGSFDLGTAPFVLDLSVPGAEPLDAPDAAVVAALDRVDDPVALWRAWRSPQPDRIEAGPVRVYLLEIGGDDPWPSEATAWLQESLSAAGVADPQVETFPTGTDLPAYQRSARGRAALLWAAAPAVPVTMTRVFDSYDPVIGGQFAVDHQVLSAGDEPARVLAYLEAGAVLLATTAREPDVFDTETGPAVPMSFRTDGRWIWTDAVAYYLRTYALSPDPELLATIRARGHRPPVVDAVTLHRALVALTGPAPATPTQEARHG